MKTVTEEYICMAAWAAMTLDKQGSLQGLVSHGCRVVQLMIRICCYHRLNWTSSQKPYPKTASGACEQTSLRERSLLSCLDLRRSI